MLDKVPGKDVTVHVIAARVRMDMKVSLQDFYFDHRVLLLPGSTRRIFVYRYKNAFLPGGGCNWASV